MAEPVVRTWLEMRTPPAAASAPLPEGARLERLDRCPPELYRELYAGVGKEWSWFDRLWWSDERLAAHLAQPEVAIRVLYLGDTPAGYYELVGHPEDRSVEIGYFGLMPHAIGRGLGRWLLAQAVEEAWGGAPERIWLHTCTLDHPAALPNYLKAGFAITGTEQVDAPKVPE